MMMICYSAECEEHYMRCYIDEPCEALQIPGMMASFFQQIKTASQWDLAWTRWKWSLNQTVNNLSYVGLTHWPENGNAWWICFFIHSWIKCCRDTVLEISTCTHASVKSLGQVQIIDHSCLLSRIFIIGK